MGTLLVHLETTPTDITASTEDRFLVTNATITAIGVYDVERKQTAVYYNTEILEETEGVVRLHKPRTEKEMLEDFWIGATDYDIFVTFNGRSFALPMLLHRSLHHHLKPTIELVPKRFLTNQSLPYHVDLLEELTFYGAIKRQSLYDFCALYHIDLPTKTEAFPALLAAGDVTSYCRAVEDTILALQAVYEKWLQNLAPKSFINAVEL